MKNSLVIVLIGICLIRCSQEQVDSRPYPRVSTLAITDINSSGATFHGEMIYSGTSIKDYGFAWSMNKIPTFENSDTVSLGQLTSLGKFSKTVSRSLLPGTKYFVRGYLRTDSYLVYGDIVSFLSLGSETPYSIINIVPSLHLMPQGEVTVLGNFNGPFQVKINDLLVDTKNVSNVTKGQFTLQLPDTINQLNKLSINIAGKEIEARQKLSVALTRLVKSRPSSMTLNPSASVIGNKAYLGLGTDSLFTFNTRSNKFSFIGREVVPLRKSVFSFTLGGAIFFGGGKDQYNIDLKDFYTIDTLTNSVTRLPDLEDGTTISMFSIKNRGYRLNTISSPGVKHELYEIDPISKSWIKKTGLPADLNRPPVFFESDGVGYIARLTNYGWDGHYTAGTVELWSYDTELDKWAKLPVTSIRSDLKFGTVSANGKIYLVYTLTGASDLISNDFFQEFDPSTKSFRDPSFKSRVPFRVSDTFSANGVGFILSDSYLWKFDPTY